MKNMNDICISAKVCNLAPCGCNVVVFDVFNTFFLK